MNDERLYFVHRQWEEVGEVHIDKTHFPERPDISNMPIIQNLLTAHHPYQGQTKKFSKEEVDDLLSKEKLIDPMNKRRIREEYTDVWEC
jgi:hypothetical protein